MLARLRISDHPAATWANSVEPWLRAHGTNWRERRAVLAPNAAWIAALKAAAVEAGLPAMGVAWFTPGKWRVRALRARPGPPLRLALREDLHLLLELAAAQLPDNPLARAYGSDPAPFQELLDALDGAGWTPSILPDPAARELAAVAMQLRAQSGWVTAAAADRVLRDAAATGALPQLGERLLAVGFGPGDWALRPLLEAACATCADAELILDMVDYEQTCAAAWVGAWEEKLGGPAQWLENSETPAPFAPLAATLLSPVRTSVTPPSLPAETVPRLWLADNLQAEADLVVAQALVFLNEVGPVPRIGLVVGPVNSPLAREVAARLAALGLPHHDSPGHLPGRASAQALFEAWLDWQENGRLAGLVAWVREAGLRGLPSTNTAEKTEKVLKDAAGGTLSDDPAVLFAWMGTHAEMSEARAFLAEWKRLPESASWDDFLQAIMPVTEKLCWPDPREILSERAAPWHGALNAPLPRQAFLRWVRAVTRVPGRTRDPLGREPLALLQIVDAASAVAHRWTHLVLGGLQHGEWPSDNADSPLLDNARIQALNRQVLRQGSQGEGHWTVAPDRALLLSQEDRRRLERSGFSRLAGLPTMGLALTSRRVDPADGRPARLSEYFWAVARLVLGHLPTENDWTALAAASRDFREGTRKILSELIAKTFKNEAGHHSLRAAQAARAFVSRRNPETPFDEYSFCLKTPPATPLRLSGKAWEKAVAQPGATWFKSVLRVEPRWDPATDDFTRRSLGTWAHAWVRPGPTAPVGSMVKSFPLPGFELWQKLAAGRAQEIRDAMAAAFAQAGRQLPESWLDAWAHAGRVSEQWLAALAGLSDWPQALAEVNLLDDQPCELPGVGAAIPLSGRMDLVLWPREVTFAPGGFAGVNAWVVDFKTGQDKPLSVAQLAKGAGAQVALYALSLLSSGAGTLSLTLLNREAEAKQPLSGTDLSDPELSGLWQLLADFAVRGRWGEKCDLSNQYKEAGPYPAATLPVPGEILRQKWQLTHPGPP